MGFAGNGFIAADKVRDYLTYHCAEVTRRQGHTWFAIYSSLPDALIDHRVPSKYPGKVDKKPWAEVYIMFFEQGGDSLLNANEVIAQLEPVIESGR